MTELTGLPNEVLDDIAARLPGRDVKALRLTCQHLCAVASPFLFKVLYLSCNSLDLAVFETVMANPLLLRGVTELIIDDTTVCPLLTQRTIFNALAGNRELWAKRKAPYFSLSDNDSFDEPGRVWSLKPRPEFFNLLCEIYQGHEDNRLGFRDIIALRSALPGMTALRTLVVSNRNADDAPVTGAQSEASSSPVVKRWRQVGKTCRERPPFPPRCDWWDSLEPTMTPLHQALDISYLQSHLNDFIWHNGMPPTTDDDSDRHVEPRIQELDDDDDDDEDEDDAVHSDDDTQVTQAHALTQHTNEADPDDEDTGNAIQTAGAQPAARQWIAPATTKMLSRESRGVHVALVVLENRHAQGRIKEFRVDSSLEVIKPHIQPGLSLRLFQSGGPSFTARLSAGFRTTMVTKFRINLSNGMDPRMGEHLLNEGAVSCILANMPLLEEVDIEAHNMGVVAAIPDGKTYPNLRRAEFSCGLLAREELQWFLERHADTIEDLRILYCALDTVGDEDELLDEDEDEDPTWVEVADDIMAMQMQGVINLKSAAIVSGYASIPMTGCGRNRTKTPPPEGEEVWSWTLGVDDTVVPTRYEDLGHEPLPQDEDDEDA